MKRAAEEAAAAPPVAASPSDVGRRLLYPLSPPLSLTASLLPSLSLSLSLCFSLSLMSALLSACQCGSTHTTPQQMRVSYVLAMSLGSLTARRSGGRGYGKLSMLFPRSSCQPMLGGEEYDLPPGEFALVEYCNDHYVPLSLSLSLSVSACV
jgi:hypothetical protein